MVRNKKNHTAAVRFGPAIKAVALCLFLGASGVGYVWQKEQINALNERRRQNENRLEHLRRENERLSRVLAALQSPTEIEMRIRQLDLGLLAPQPEQVVRLLETPPEAEAPDTHGLRLYAAQPLRTLVHP